MNILRRVEEATRIHCNDSRPGSGNRKKLGNVFPRRNSKTTAWRLARPIMRNVLFAKVISTPSSHPLDKDGPFGEVEYGCKAENKDAV